jgi:serine/threonine-protein kinase RsbW
VSDTVVNSRVVFDSPPATVDDIHRVLEEFWQKAPGIDLVDRLSFETALIELSSNVIRHADDGHGLSCELEISCTEDALTAELQDTGRPGGLYESAPDMPDVDSESGRGLPIIHALVNAVTYERISGYNRWYLMRKLGGEWPVAGGHGYAR